MTVDEAAGEAEEDGGSLLEKAGKALILFAAIAFVTMILFAVLAVTSYVEPYYSVPHIAQSLAPIVILSIVALIAGTIALVAAKVAD